MNKHTERYKYEREEVMVTASREDLENIVSGVDRDHGMFDVVVGNPPYQDISSREDGASTTAIYHNFMIASQSVANLVSLIFPARWLTGGKGEGIDEFREKELNSENYINFVVNPDIYFFENTKIRGGINYFLWKRERSGLTNYVYDNNEAEKRKTLMNGYPTFISDSIFSRVLRKVNTQCYIKTTSKTYYGAELSSDYIEDICEEHKTKDNVAIYYSSRRGGINKAYIPKSLISKDTGNYKVFISAVASDPKGIALRRPSRIFTGNEEEIASGTFLSLNHLSSIREAENLLKYMKTNFVIFLYGVLTPTQNANSSSYRLIPDIDTATGEIKDKPGVFLDFTGNSDDLDDQLAGIYELTPAERDFISSRVIPWKDKNSLTADGLF